MKKKTDLRVLRTKKMIYEAFMKLVAEKGYDAVSVQQIADEAMINRATFYAHFKDKPDLYEQIFDFSLGPLISLLNSDPLVTNNRVRVKDIENLLTKIFMMIKENRLFFLTLTEGSANEIFRKKLADLIATNYESLFNNLKITENDIEVPIDFIIEYMTSIFVGTVHWWVSTDSDFPPEHMARLIVKLIGNGHLTVLGVDVEK